MPAVDCRDGTTGRLCRAHLAEFKREITMFAKRAAYLAVYGLMCASFAGIPANSAAAFTAAVDAAANLSKQMPTVLVAGRSYGPGYIDSQRGWGTPYQCMTDDG